MDPERQLPPAILRALDRLDNLVEKFEEHPEPAVRERVLELLQCIDTIHRAGLYRLVEVLESAGAIETRLALDAPEIRLLLNLYDLREGGERARIDALVESVQPLLEAQGRTLDVEKAGAGVLQVHLSAANTGCAETDPPLRQVIEEILRTGLPDLVHLEVLESAPLATPTGFVPLSSLKVRKPPRLTWQAVLQNDDTPETGVRAVEVGGERILLASLNGQVDAYRDVCPGTPLPLHGGQVQGTVLRCPWHRCRFDLRDGSRLDAAGPGLERLPVAVERGEIRVGLRL